MTVADDLRAAAHFLRLHGPRISVAGSTSELDDAATALQQAIADRDDYLGLARQEESRAEDLEAQVQRLTASLADAEEALKPFANLSRFLPDERPDDENVCVELHETLDAETVARIGASSPNARLVLAMDSLTVKDIRRAAAIRSRQEKP